MIKLKRQIINDLQKWLDDNDFDVKCKFGKSLAYMPEDNIITLTKDYDDEDDDNIVIVKKEKQKKKKSKKDKKSVKPKKHKKKDNN